jgi:hypothetical protein
MASRARGLHRRLDLRQRQRPGAGSSLLLSLAGRTQFSSWLHAPMM